MVAGLGHLHFDKVVANLRMFAFETGKRKLILKLTNLYTTKVLLKVIE